MIMFTCDYQCEKVLIISLYHSAIIAINSTISLANAQIMIFLLPAGKCDGRHKTKDCNRNSLEKCVKCVKNRERNFKNKVFSRECPAMVKARAFVIWKTDLDGKKND